eukprot:c3684_g1_i1.p1 GENE.c3684_g1_i1~~c3684_g1_i1.p1  ORF type:complete len:253 (-),score=51.79 c3684_g1_i1:766-1467(-)
MAPMCNNTICNAIGRIGFRACSEMRGRLYGITLTLSCIAFIFSLVGAIGISTDTQTIKNVPWSVSTGSKGNAELKLYVGIEAVVMHFSSDITHTEQKTKWDSVDCKQSYCTDCKSAATGCATTVIIGTITILLSIKTQYTRGFGKDSNFNKTMGMLTGMLSFVTLLSALASFAKSCKSNIPTSVNDIELTTTFGVGFVLVLLSCITKFIVTVVHCLVPTRRAISRLDQFTAAP